MEMMRAFVIEEPGGPEKLELREMPRPEPRDGWVLIRNRAFGLNRSEWFTRRGQSPTVKFPRVLGIECVGEVVAAPGTNLSRGTRVAAMMGGMGQQFDRSYAEYVLVPSQHVFPLKTNLDWKTLGATSSIGFATIALARAAGLELTATTRSATRADELVAAGATHVLVDDGSIASKARAIYPNGFDRVLELVGATTLLDSLQAARRGGIVCMTGIHPRSFKNTFHSSSLVNSNSSSDRTSPLISSRKRTPRWTRTEPLVRSL